MVDVFPKSMLYARAEKSVGNGSTTSSSSTFWFWEEALWNGGC